MGPALPVVPSKTTRGIFSSLFFPSVNALLAVGMHINSSEEGLEGSGGLPLTLVRHDVVKTRSPASVLMKLHVIRLHCKQRKVNEKNTHTYSAVWREVSGGFMSQATMLEDSQHKDSLCNTMLKHRDICIHYTYYGCT